MKSRLEKHLSDELPTFRLSAYPPIDRRPAHPGFILLTVFIEPMKMTHVELACDLHDARVRLGELRP
jgi:hypothetical protein